MQRTTIPIGYSAKEEAIARYAKALSHPIRIRILGFLEKQSCCFTDELTEEIPMAQSTISQHLKELKDAGLIQGDVMPPRVKYFIIFFAYVIAFSVGKLGGYFKAIQKVEKVMRIGAGIIFY